MKILLIKIVEYLFTKLTSGDAMVNKAKSVSNTVDTVLILITAAVDRLIVRLKDIVTKLEEISASAKDTKIEINTDNLQSVLTRVSELKNKDSFKRAEVLEVLNMVQVELSLIVK